jgi:hypothetical protein
MKNDCSMLTNYNSSYSSFMPNMDNANATADTGQYQQGGKNGYYYDSEYFNRKYDHINILSNKTVTSPCSSTEESPLTPPEAPYNSSAMTSTTAGAVPTLSPSLITQHAISKDEYTQAKYMSSPATATGDCSYRNNESIVPYNKDANQVSKHSQESYRIFSNQLHYHHHYHYSMQSPTSSSGSSAGLNYPPYQSNIMNQIDTDVDPKEMEQYLDGATYRKCYVPSCNVKSEGSLTELSPVVSSTANTNPPTNLNETYIPSTINASTAASNTNAVAPKPVSDTSITNTVESINQTPSISYNNNYQENLSAYQYMNNWVNYSI